MEVYGYFDEFLCPASSRSFNELCVPLEAGLRYFEIYMEAAARLNDDRFVELKPLSAFGQECSFFFDTQIRSHTQSDVALYVYTAGRDDSGERRDLMPAVAVVDEETGCCTLGRIVKQTVIHVVPERILTRCHGRCPYAVPPDKIRCNSRPGWLMQWLLRRLLALSCHSRERQQVRLTYWNDARLITKHDRSELASWIDDFAKREILYRFDEARLLMPLERLQRPIRHERDEDWTVFEPAQDHV